jgi:hypothetical protein
MKLFKKKKQDEVPIKLSEQALLFIKKYAIPALNIQEKIDEDSAINILGFAVQCELNMINDQGYDRTEEYPEKERDFLGHAYVTETSAYGIDLEYLNKRLGLV